MGEDIVIVEYDPSWPARFEAEAAAIHGALGDRVVAAIEHVGSTAVPGLAAKPIIDIDLALRSPADKPRAIAALEGLGYSYWRANPKPDHTFFVKGRRSAPDAPITFTCSTARMSGGIGCCFATSCGRIPMRRGRTRR